MGNPVFNIGVTRTIRCPKCNGTKIVAVGPATHVNSIPAVPVRCACGHEWASRARHLVLAADLAKLAAMTKRSA
jgi:hypothetical protein